MFVMDAGAAVSIDPWFDIPFSLMNIVCGNSKTWNAGTVSRISML